MELYDTSGNYQRNIAPNFTVLVSNSALSSSIINSTGLEKNMKFTNSVDGTTYYFGGYSNTKTNTVLPTMTPLIAGWSDITTSVSSSSYYGAKPIYTVWSTSQWA
jgi:hypothetical protein